MKAYERFLEYVKVNTQSDHHSAERPTTKCQFRLAELLAEEMKKIGLENVRVTNSCYVYGTLPATAGYEQVPAIGWIAHMDTSPDASGDQVKPRLHENYNGEDVVLGNGLTLSVKNFPHLPKLKGRTLITTDGTTLLGGDDKAGIAEILTACEIILAENLPHGKLCIGFTPDEEVGHGADGFDIPAFGADFAYTLDGGEEGELEYENFNAADAVFRIKGFSIHPGSSKNRMVNASLVAMEINSMLPGGDIPAKTEGYEGFYHLCDMSGNVGEAVLTYIVRDHDRNRFEGRKETLRHIEKLVNEKYGEGTASLTLTDSYQNMKELIEPCMHLIDHAKDAMEKLGIDPIIVPIRGGTDGAVLSYMGLPCPNLGTGGYGAHGPYEHITAEGMELCTRIMVGIVTSYAEGGK